MRYIKIFGSIGIMLAYAAAGAEQAKNFRVSAVEESQVWIEGGLLDGLQEGMDGEIFYEISVAGQKKRIVPARVRLYKVGDRQSMGTLKEQSGTVNIGYSAALVPRPASEMLTFLQTRATEAYSAKDYNLAKDCYQKILDALPEDPFAAQKIKDCDQQLEKLAALQRERRNVPYYKQVIRASMEEKNESSLKLAQTYIDKILAIAPGDPEAVKLKEEVAALARSASVPPKSQETSAGTGKKVEVAAGPDKHPEKTEVSVSPETPKPAAEPQKVQMTRMAEEPKRPIETPKPQIEPPPVLRDMALIPESDVIIGSEPQNTSFANETPRQTMHLLAFYIDKYEVTNEDYKRFCDATARACPGYFVDGNYPEGTGRRPVVMISWIDADAYARWAGKRLPTEREWEAAAAGPGGRTWPWGNVWDPTAANTREGGGNSAATPGSYPGDISVFGAYDMAGNVSEWTADWYQPYPGNKRKEKEYGESFRVLRGGSFQVSKGFARSQFRARLPNSFRSMDLGFRCAISAKDAKQ
jgi:formylglycine-generating enzyme required for sulfatase activity